MFNPSVISIHAPLRERRCRGNLVITMRRFQSTLPHGSDIKSILRVMLRPYFNPRSLAGATSACLLSIYRIRHFNPRSLAGATGETKAVKDVLKISIHAPSRERLGWTFGDQDVYLISIHAPSRERLQGFSPSVRLRDFNPRSLAGATMVRQKKCHLLFIFQSTLPRGSDRRNRG